MLFKASALAIQKTAANPSFLGVQSGSASVLHTWGQALNYHPHIHALVPAGGLVLMDKNGLMRPGMQCFALLGTAPVISQYEGLTMPEVLFLITGRDTVKCPQCKKGNMVMQSSSPLPTAVVT